MSIFILTFSLSQLYPSTTFFYNNIVRVIKKNNKYLYFYF